MVLNEHFWGLALLIDCSSLLLTYMIVMGARLKFTITRSLIYIAVFVTSVTLIVFPINDNNIRDIIGIVFLMPVVFLLAGSKKKWMALFLPNLVALSVAQTIFIPTLSFAKVIMGKNGYSAFVSIVVFILLSVAYYFIHPIQGAEHEYSVGQIIFLNIISVCLFILLGEIQRFFNTNTTYIGIGASKLIHNAMLGACVLLCILAFYLSVIKGRLDDAKRIAEENEFLLRMQSEQMDTVIKSEEKLHAFKHDLIAHLNALSGFAEEGDVSKVKDYCDNLLTDTASFARVAYTGNPALDGVLNQLKGMANDSDVDLDIRMTVPKEKKISDYDLCIITFNIIKNAIEANRGGGKVEIKSWPFNENLCIISSNTTTHSLEYKNGVLLSTKREYKAPGYGMRNIQAVIDKYDGDFQIKMDGDLVKVEALV
ncbi:GHKL domain-containing protein [Pseudobutyrivibrio xylanivorans]|uniref:Sensor histidine kinase YesM n=2 Tax=Pseudobutyrivibrio TaxID=46205 RepID=A0A1G5RQV1_PSEXY|nr:GHKL domain-containing protein [Pseudobutyrivibrio xylanivorans]SCZ76366.1 Sensor histidine kinase YesM [Pseudobutyrivibrio xylanivorans]